jgi:hypothetical protein
MSLLLIRQALEIALAAVPGSPTAWENQNFTPGAGPFRRAWLMPAEPINPEIGGTYIEHGLFQVSVFHPPGDGNKDAITEAENIRAAFPRRATFTQGGVSVMVEATPYIGPAIVDDNRYVLSVRIPFRSFIKP